MKSEQSQHHAANTRGAVRIDYPGSKLNAITHKMQDVILISECTAWRCNVWQHSEKDKAVMMCNLAALSLTKYRPIYRPTFAADARSFHASRRYESWSRSPEEFELPRRRFRTLISRIREATHQLE